MKQVLVILILLMSACEVVVDVAVPIKPAAITVHSYINPDSIVEVQLTSSQHVLSEGPFEYIEDANVDLFENGNFLERLSEIRPGIYRGQNYPSINNTYRLEAAKSSYATIKAETVVPDTQGLILSVKYKHVDPGAFGNSAEVTFTVELNDPAGPNYYELIVVGPSYTFEYDYDTRQSVVTDTLYLPYGLRSDDPIFSSQVSLNGGLPFTDTFFEGKTASVTFNTYIPVFWHFPEAEADVRIILREVSEQLYHFDVTGSLQQSLQGDPFAEPVPVSNNVENGYGVFGGYSQKSYTLIVKKE